MKRSRTGLMLAAGLVFLGLAWAWVLARNVAWDRMQDVHSQIREVTYADFMLNLEVLRIRSGVVAHYDDVSRASQHLNESSRTLQDYVQLLDMKQPEALDSLQNLQDRVKEKIAFVEGFLAQNSILRNSESYLPSLLDDYGRQHTQELAHAVQSLLLRTLVLTDQEAGRHLKRQLEALVDASQVVSALGDVRTKVGLHGLKTLEIRQSILPMMHTLLSIPVHEAITQLNAIVIKEQTAQESKRERSRNVLYVAALGFFVLSLVMLFRFVRLNRKIKKFVPYEMLNLLGKSTLLDIEYGTSIQREMTVMFVDLRDFSRTCESRKPSENFAFVNEYLAAITPAIERHQGFVSQFSGDGFMALFPGSSDDALNAALNLIQALSELNQNRHRRGEEGLAFGIGINTSELMLGAIGHHRRMECSVLGNGVNVAARVEGLTRIYGCEILLTESSMQRLKSPETFHLRQIDHVRPKGLKEPVQLFELLDVQHSALHQRKAADAPEFQKARCLYQERRFSEAAVVFGRLGLHDPVSALYQQRCLDFQKTPLESDWKGIADFSVK